MDGLWLSGWRLGGDEIFKSLQANLKCPDGFLFIDVELVVIVVIYDPTSGRISLPTIKAFCQPRSIAQLHSDLKHRNTIKI